MSQHPRLAVLQQQEHPRKAERAARQRRYEQIDDAKALIRLYEDRICELRTWMRTLVKLNSGVRR